MRFLRIRVSIVLLISLTATGCSALNIQKPTVVVTRMVVNSVDISGFTMNFDLRVDNPNSVALPIAGADYKLALAAVDVLSGQATPQGSIPAGGSLAVSLPVRLTYENLLAAEQGIVKSGGDVPYSLDGGLSFESGVPIIGRLRAGLQNSGTLPLKEVLRNPQAILQNPAAQKLAKELLGRLFER